MIRGLRRALAVASGLLLLAVLVLHWRSTHLPGYDYLDHATPDGELYTFIHDGQLVIEEYDHSDRTAIPRWSLGHRPIPPGDSFAAEMELATPRTIFPGVATSDWTHFPAAGNFRITILSPNLFFVTFAVLPALEIFLLLLRHHPRHHRPTAGAVPCPTCGYDLRAHYPGQKCPECGTPIPAANTRIT